MSRRRPDLDPDGNGPTINGSIAEENRRKYAGQLQAGVEKLAKQAKEIDKGGHYRGVTRPGDKEKVWEVDEIRMISGKPAFVVVKEMGRENPPKITIGVSNEMFKNKVDSESK